MLKDPSGSKSGAGQHLIDPAVLAAKNISRDKILKASGLSTRQAMTEKIEDLIDPSDIAGTGGRIVKSPALAEHLGLNQSVLNNDAWSGSYWPMYLGHTAQRYSISAAKNANSWLEAWAQVSTAGKTFLDAAMGRSPAVVVDDLGPAEKYDLLIAAPPEQPQGSLSKYEWDHGREELKNSGSVSKWLGYCHGWAPAAVMFKRPMSIAEVPSADGLRRVRFYPSDIKALATTLWANALPPARIVGSRCDNANPEVDENGHIVDEACFSANPGVFHMALINQVGVAKRNLWIDVSYSAEVWNHPITRYLFRYFNPESGTAGAFDESVIAIEDYTKDKFKKYRPDNARQIVGVAMQIEYVTETLPFHTLTDGPSQDMRKTVTYRYDLELDHRGEIIGGEWYQLKHPDFIWSVAKDARAVSDNETDVKGVWNSQSPIPLSWRAEALHAATKGQPLAAIVEKLAKLSRKERD